MFQYPPELRKNPDDGDGVSLCNSGLLNPPDAAVSREEFIELIFHENVKKIYVSYDDDNTLELYEK
jgi:hypothetical protein